MNVCAKKEEHQLLAELDIMMEKFKPFKPVTECSACEKAMTSIKQQMAFNGTAAKLSNLMDKVCLSVPYMFSSKCWSIKAKYMDALLNFIESTETPAQICAVSIFTNMFPSTLR